jgi:hypothetical protein
MPPLRKDHVTNRISLSTYLTYPALKYKDSRACPSRIYSPRNYRSKADGGLGGVPIEMPPSKDKTISHGLDAVGGSVAFSIGFQVVLKPEKYN